MKLLDITIIMIQAAMAAAAFLILPTWMLISFAAMFVVLGAIDLVRQSRRF